MIEEYNQEQHDNSLRVDASAGSYMLETARWAKFLAVIGFVGLGIVMLGAVILLFTPMNNEYSAAFNAGYKTGMIIFYLIILMIFFYPMYALLKFANMVKSSILSQNQVEFDEAFRHLKNTFKFWGIYTIVLLFIYGIFIVFATTIALTTGATN